MTTPISVFQFAASDESTAITTGFKKVAVRIPFAITSLASVRASLTTPQTSGSLLTVDVKVNGVSILSTLLTFDNTEKTTVTAATSSVLNTTTISDDDEITVDVTQVGDGTAKGLKIALIPSSATAAATSSVFDFEFLEADNSTSTTDSGPYAIAATLSGGAKVTGGKLTLAAVGDYMTIFHRGRANFRAHDFSLSFKFKTSQTQQFTTLMAREGTGGDSTAGSWFLGINTTTGDGKLALYTGDLGGSPFFASTTGGFANGVERTCVLARVNNTLTLSIDGSVIATGTTKLQFVDVSSPLNVGLQSYNPTTRQFIGTFDAISLTVG